jgi:hypothetical protein
LRIGFPAVFATPYISRIFSTVAAISVRRDCGARTSACAPQERSQERNSSREAREKVADDGGAETDADGLGLAVALEDAEGAGEVFARVEMVGAGELELLRFDGADAVDFERADGAVVEREGDEIEGVLVIGEGVGV